MNAGARRSRRILPSALVLLLLAGCGGLLPKPAERTLYRLTPVFELRQPLPRVGAQLVVATPAASAGLDSKRIALSRSPVTIDYFADAEWVDRPPFLVKEALVEAFETSRAFSGVASEGSGLNADFVLNTRIREFAAIYDSPNGPPLIRVGVDGELVTMPGRTIASETTASREARAAANDLPAIVAAFDRAVGGVIEQLLTWTVTNPALPGRRR